MSADLGVLADITAASACAWLRTSSMSGPLMRYWIGRPTGGPMSSSLDECVGAEEGARQIGLELGPQTRRAPPGPW
jgi:hypothetical protein